MKYTPETFRTAILTEKTLDTHDILLGCYQKMNRDWFISSTPTTRESVALQIAHFATIHNVPIELATQCHRAAWWASLDRYFETDHGAEGDVSRHEAADILLNNPAIFRTAMQNANKI